MDYYNSILLGILFLFNSTAVVSEYLYKNGELKTDFGKTILNILLLQDVFLATVLSVFQFLGNGTTSFIHVAISLIASSAIFFY